MFDILATRCGEGDMDHTIVTTVFLIDNSDITLEHRVFLIRDDEVHVYDDRSCLRGEALTG